MVATLPVILGGGLVAGGLSMATCAARKNTLASGGLGALGGGALGFLAKRIWDYLTDPMGAANDVGKFALDLVTATLGAVENALRATGAGLLADAVGQARALFEELQRWVESRFGSAGRMLIGLSVVYLVISRFFLRR
jgi:hypothetical protein